MFRPRLAAWCALLPNEEADVLVGEHIPLIRGHKDQMSMEGRYRVPATAVVIAGCHRPAVGCGAVPVRYRYWLYPSPGQPRVITLAKLTAEREWLAQAPSVALAQACNDARRAYRNWFRLTHRGAA